MEGRMARPSKSRKHPRRRRSGTNTIASRYRKFLESPVEPVADWNREQIDVWREQYSRVRAAGKRLNMHLPSLVPSEGLRFSAEHLGILRGDIFVFGSEDETAVLIDHAIYNYRQDGLTVIQRYARENPPRPGTDEETWLQAALRAYHSIFLVVGVVKDFGLQTRDVFSGEEVLVADINSSRCADVGFSFASRMLPLENFSFTGGATLPIVDVQVLERVDDYLQRTCAGVKDFRTMPRERALLLESFITRTCLASGASERVRYQ
jgi:hypothetical protein